MCSTCRPDVTSLLHGKISRMLNGRNVDVLAPISGAHFNWIVLISQPLTVLIIQMVRVVDVDCPHPACSCICCCSGPGRIKEYFLVALSVLKDDDDCITPCVTNVCTDD